jgi:hypothetical protein
MTSQLRGVRNEKEKILGFVNNTGLLGNQEGQKTMVRITAHIAMAQVSNRVELPWKES